jgi:hypothetical protein
LLIINKLKSLPSKPLKLFRKKTAKKLLLAIFVSIRL